MEGLPRARRGRVRRPGSRRGGREQQQRRARGAPRGLWQHLAVPPPSAATMPPPRPPPPLLDSHALPLSLAAPQTGTDGSDHSYRMVIAERESGARGGAHSCSSEAAGCVHEAALQQRRQQRRSGMRLRQRQRQAVRAQPVSLARWLGLGPPQRATAAAVRRRADRTRAARGRPRPTGYQRMADFKHTITRLMASHVSLAAALCRAMVGRRPPCGCAQTPGARS